MSEYQDIPKKKKPPGKNGEFTDPYKLDEKDTLILKYLLNYPGMKKGEIAAKVGILPSALSARLNKPAVKRAIVDAVKSVTDIMDNNAKLAARRLASLINDPDKKIALEAIRMALHTYLNTATVKIQNVHEIMYVAQFGGDGQITTDKKEIQAPSTPKDTLALLGKDVIDV